MLTRRQRRRERKQPTPPTLDPRARVRSALRGLRRGLRQRLGTERGFAVLLATMIGLIIIFGMGQPANAGFGDVFSDLFGDFGVPQYKISDNPNDTKLDGSETAPLSNYDVVMEENPPSLTNPLGWTSPISWSLFVIAQLSFKIAIVAVGLSYWLLQKLVMGFVLGNLLLKPIQTLATAYQGVVDDLHLQTAAITVCILIFGLKALSGKWVKGIGEILFTFLLVGLSAWIMTNPVGTLYGDGSGKNGVLGTARDLGVEVAFAAMQDPVTTNYNDAINEYMDRCVRHQGRTVEDCNASAPGQVGTSFQDGGSQLLLRFTQKIGASFIRGPHQIVTTGTYIDDPKNKRFHTKDCMNAYNDFVRYGPYDGIGESKTNPSAVAREKLSAGCDKPAIEALGEKPNVAVIEGCKAWTDFRTRAGQLEIGVPDLGDMINNKIEADEVAKSAMYRCWAEFATGPQADCIEGKKNQLVDKDNTATITQWTLYDWAWQCLTKDDKEKIDGSVYAYSSTMTIGRAIGAVAVAVASIFLLLFVVFGVVAPVFGGQFGLAAIAVFIPFIFVWALVGGGARNGLWGAVGGATTSFLMIALGFFDLAFVMITIEALLGDPGTSPMGRLIMLDVAMFCLYAARKPVMKRVRGMGRSLSTKLSGMKIGGGGNANFGAFSDEWKQQAGAHAKTMGAMAKATGTSMKNHPLAWAAGASVMSGGVATAVGAGAIGMSAAKRSYYRKQDYNFRKKYDIGRAPIKRIFDEVRDPGSFRRRRVAQLMRDARITYAGRQNALLHGMPDALEKYDASDTTLWTQADYKAGRTTKDQIGKPRGGQWKRGWLELPFPSRVAGIENGQGLPDPYGRGVRWRLWPGDSPIGSFMYGDRDNA